MPKVSVIVPLYRAKNFLVPCVSALKRQGISDMEILLVDDCSPDDTYACALELFGNDEKVRVIRQAENGGPGKARNKGIELAKGEYICFCDVDDLYVDGAVSGMLYEAERLDADVYCSNEFYLTVVDPLPDDLSVLPEANLLKVGFISMEESRSEGKCEIAGSIKERMDLWLEHRYHWSVFGKIFKTDFLRAADIRFSDARLGEDQLFMLKALIKAGIYVDQVKATYIYRAGNTSSSSRGSGNPGVFLDAERAIFKSIDVIDDAVRNIPFFDEHPEYTDRLKAFHIKGLEDGYAVPKFLQIGRAALSRNEAVEALFSEYFGTKGSFVKKTLFDAYGGRSADASFEAFVAYENLKKLQEAAQGFFSLLPQG